MIKLKLSHLLIFCFVFFLTVNPIQAQTGKETSRKVLNFNQDWRFLKEDANGAEVPAFDGVMANSDVWINGFHLGKRPYGYISFSYDLTGH
jgi:beta-galactosidase/beta-glucuronidase